MLETTFEQVRGRRVRRARLGQGSAVVLLHGYPDNLQIWSALAPELAQRFDVIAFDWPGMGYSEPWPGGTTPAHQSDRLLELLDAWGVGRATLIGTDMGAQPALCFAARHPDRIDKLVVMNALALWDAEVSWEIALLRQFQFNRLVIRNLPRIVFRRAERTFLPSGTRLPPALRADLWESFRRPEVRAFIARLCGGYQGALPRLPQLYPTIACPTLVLWAGQDKHFPLAHARGLHASIAGSKLEIIPEAEHWMPWYLAAEVWGRMSGFL